MGWGGGGGGFQVLCQGLLCRGHRQWASADLILLLEGNDLRQRRGLPLHAVDALHHNQNLAPGPVCAGLASCNAGLQQHLQVLGVIMPEHLQPFRRCSTVHWLSQP